MRSENMARQRGRAKDLSSTPQRIRRASSPRMLQGKRGRVRKEGEEQEEEEDGDKGEEGYEEYEQGGGRPPE